ncbi:MAG: hypothetical protein JWM12_1014, partial [Ilumatobacteraceae bacterium]|nr:hypothetical protein [Ilumatobacteraceae bacterium]
PTVAPTDAPTTAPVVVVPTVAPTTAAPAPPAVTITGDQIRAAVLTPDDLDPAEGWTATNPGDSGDDLCGQFPVTQPFAHSSSAFERFDAQGVDQFLSNEIQVYSTAADADAEFEHEVSVVQNCVDGQQTINGVVVEEQMTALRANSALMSSFPGCEKAASALVHSTVPSQDFDHQTTVWYMRCGNATLTVGLDEPNGSDVDESSSVVFTSVLASYNKVIALPLQH